MVDIIDIYKSLNISIVTVNANREMLKLVPDHFKTESMCKCTTKKLLYQFRYVPDQYKTQQVCDKVVLANGETLNIIPCSYKNQEMVIKLSRIRLMH